MTAEGYEVEWAHLETHWRLYASRVRERWEHLTDEDLMSVDGQLERMVDKLLHRYGYTKARAHGELKAFAQEQMEGWK